MNFQLDKTKLDWLTSRTNRSNGQTEFLFELVDGNFEKLKALEVKIKNCFYFACPADKEEVERVFSMSPKTDYFRLD